MSTFDLIHFMTVESVDCGATGTQQLLALRERAAQVARNTGREPVSWYEFKHAAARSEIRTLTNMIFGCSIGLACGIALGLAFEPLMFPLMLSSTLIGGTIGAFSDTENSRRNRLIVQYGQYLDDFEQQHPLKPEVTAS